MFQSREDIAWVAGLLEGEGCFRVKRQNRALEVSCAMSDQDTIGRLHRIAGGNLQTPYQRENRKKIYPWCLSKREDVVDLISTLRPFMSARRAERIDEMLLFNQENPKSPSRDGNPPGHGTISRYTSRKDPCRCSLCKAANKGQARHYKRRIESNVDSF